MRHWIFTFSFLLAAGAFATENSEVTEKQLLLNQAQLVLYKDASGMSNRSLVYCAHDAASAAGFLSMDEKVGGILLLAGSEVHFKNNQDAKFADGSQISEKIITIKCLKQATSTGEKI